MQLIVQDLVVARGGRKIISGLCFSLAGGEALLLTGRNGAGKTTLIRALGGFLPPVSGTIELAGWDGDRDMRQACHYVGHLDANKAALTVLENLRFWQRYLGAAPAAETGAPAAGAEERLWHALETFGIDALADIPAGYLSAGQKRRLGLARLLVAERPLWLLDEPTVSLDAASTAMMADVICRHVVGGGLVVAATHLPLGLAQARELRLGAEVAAA